MGTLALVNSFKNIFFPCLCALCSENIALPSEGVCDRCAGLFAQELISSPLCLICGIPFSPHSGGDHACGSCIKKPPSFVRARSLYVFNGEVRRAVHELKYRWGTRLGPFLALGMAHAVIKNNFDVDVIVPVPLHKNKIRKRGFNQSVVIARQMARVLSVPLDITNFVRIKSTLSQVGLAGAERRGNMAGAFEVRDAKAFEGKKTLLVDDVFTTGSTVNECAKVLKKAGTEVAVITIARAL